MRCHASSICHANIIYASFSLLKAIFFSLLSHLHVGLHACSWHIGALEPHQLFDSLLPLTQFGTAFSIGCSVWNRFIGGLESLFYHTVAGLRSQLIISESRKIQTQWVCRWLYGLLSLNQILPSSKRRDTHIQKRTKIQIKSIDRREDNVFSSELAPQKVSSCPEEECVRLFTAN
jgi:hypothetical protein